MSFASDLEDIADKMMTDVDEVRQAVAIELFGAVINDTPVDTGRAQGNWQTTMAAPAQGDTPQTGSTVAMQQVRSVVAKSSLEDDVYLTNNLPYIEALEYGHSKLQAPAGMVRKNMALTLQNLKAGAKK